MKYEIKENKQYIYFAYLISIFTIMPQLIATIFSVVGWKHIILLLIILVTLFLISKFSKLLFAIFIFYLNLINILIGHIFIHWGYTYADIGSRIDVAVISPRSETFEYLMTYIDYRDMLLVLYSSLVLIALYRFIVHFSHSFKIIKFLAFIMATIIVVGISFFRYNFINKEPFNIPIKCNDSLNYNVLYNSRAAQLKNIKSVSHENINTIYNKIIIIQGEAVNKHHMSIYGYNKNTTPFLSSLKSKDDFYIFNAIAPANLTRYSVPILHTKATVQNFQKLFLNSKSNVGNYRDYGYKTYWISNQGMVGWADTFIASVAHEANINFFENLDSYYDVNPDQVLVSYLNKKNEIETKKELYVFHLMGSHSRYKERYTQDHILFEKPLNIQEEYDNTIFYTDYILKNIFEYFLKKYSTEKILFVYISDHGEVVDKNDVGHGYLSPYKDEYDVPFVIYSNIKNNRIDALYGKNKNGLFNLENLNYMIDYVTGISDDLNISYSSKVFAAEPENIFDYNKLSFHK